MASPKPRGLLSLPNEILIEICREFCLHCQYEERQSHGEVALVSLGNDMFEVGRHGRAVLARLSRTCKALTPVAQPLLFHFFHTGNLPRMLESMKWDDVSYSPGKADDDMLLSFLRTLLDRPDLGMHVRALALYYAKPVRAAATTDLSLIPRIRTTIRQIFQHPNKRQYDDDFRLHDFAVTLAPNVEQLLIGGVGSADMIYRGELYFESNDKPVPGPTLSRLRYAAFVATPYKLEWQGTYHMLMLMPLVGRAPNLEVLVATDAGDNFYNEGAFLNDEPWTAPLTWLRKLSVKGVAPEIICTVFSYCPALEDLSYGIDTGALPFGRENQEDLTLLREDHMTALYPSLRRFLYSVVDSHYYTREWAQSAADDQQSKWWFSAVHRSVNRLQYVSFRGFAQLAILEVEHVMFYDDNEAETSRGPHQGRTEHARDCVTDSAPRRLLEALPASLQILHIGFVINWIDFYHDMEVLALGAALQVPKLRILRADCVVMPPTEEVDDLITLLRASSITFSVGETPKRLEDIPSGLIEDRPGYPCGQEDPFFVYGLDSLDSLS